MGEFRLPDYGPNSLLALPGSIAALLRGSGRRVMEPLRDLLGVSRLLLLVLDGVGYDLFANVVGRVLKDCPKPARISTIYPSTTAAVLTTVSTGLPAGVHGMLEWNLYVPEINMLIESIPFRPIGLKGYDVLSEMGVSPTVLFRGRTLFSRLGSEGVKTRAFVRAHIHDTCYTRRLLGGAERVPYVNVTDLSVALAREVRRGDARLIYVYIEATDTIAHLYGYGTEEQEADLENTLRVILGRLAGLGPELGGDVGLVIASDHGLLTMEPEGVVYLDKRTRLKRYLLRDENGVPLVSGSPRNAYLHVKEGYVDRVVRIVEDVLGDRAWILTRDELVKRRLLGRVSSRVARRVGDVIVLPDEGTSAWIEHFAGRRVRGRGFHGGLSRVEMEVPLLPMRLSELRPATS